MITQCDKLINTVTLIVIFVLFVYPWLKKN